MSKVALVTGAGQRIGREIALDLARDGWSVAAHYNTSIGPAEEVADIVVSEGGRAAVLCADLGDEDQAATLVDQATEKLGPVTCLINNASVFEKDLPLDVTREGWDRHMQINLRTPFVLIQSMALRLPKGVQGNAINMIDQRVWNLTPFFTSYTLSKAGLWTLTQTLALALAPRLRVNAIGPGPTLPSSRQSKAGFEHQWRSLPLPRPTGIEEICQAVRFILAAPAMTGQMIVLDGGQHLGWAPAPNDQPPEE